MTTTYCTLFRVGYWASLDAKCVAETDDDYGIVTHSVHFTLINEYGARLAMGFCIISEGIIEGRVWDEDGDRYPTVDAAIRAYAAQRFLITPMPGQRVAKPPRHDLWDGSVGTAFREAERTS
jgi:hypothetical protein